MIVLGLTGSIGMGKSTTAELFQEEGASVFDADAAVHTLYSGAAVRPVEIRFPGTTKHGSIDRVALGKAIVDDPKALADLERIIHPLIRELEMEFIDSHRAAGAGMVVLDIPLLFETDGDELCDKTIVVTAPASVQRARVQAREGMTPEKFDALLSRQMSDSEKRSRADFLIHTHNGIEDARRQVRAIVETIAK